MRWQRLTSEQKEAAKKLRHSRWHRKFAWWPKWDQQSQIVYWLEHVWVRGYGDWWHSMKRFNAYEYRGGRECPELKQAPPPRPLPSCSHGRDILTHCAICDAGLDPSLINREGII